MLELRPPEVRLDDELALLGEALHAADDEVQLAERLHGEVEVARVDLAREARVGELAAVVAEPPRQVAVRRQQLVQLELLENKLEQIISVILATLVSAAGNHNFEKAALQLSDRTYQLTK